MNLLRLRKNKEEKLRELFEKANAENFSVDVINKLSKEYDESEEAIRRFLNAYVLNYGDYSDEEIKYYTDIISKDVVDGVNIWKSEKEKKEVLEYIDSFYENSRDKEEAVKFLASVYKITTVKMKKVIEYSKESKEKIISLPIIKSKKKKKDELKNKEKLEEIIAKKVTPKKSITKEVKKEETNYSRLYDQLVLEEDIIEIVKLIDNFKNNNTFVNFKASLEEYLKVYRKEFEYDYIRDIINDKIKRYRNFKKNKDNNSDDIETVKNFINGYLLSSMSLREYLQRNNMSDLSFKTYASIVRKNDLDLFNKLSMKVKSDSLLETERFKNMIKTLVNYIESGYTLSDGTVKEFDIIDYHIYTHYSLKELLNKAKNIIDEKDYAKLKSFSIKYPFTAVWSDRTINNYYDTKLYFDTKMDDKGNIISSRELTNENKEEILNFLMDNNVPIYQRTINVAEKRFLNNTLYTEERFVKL